jgi:actin beta/gamma 1
MSNDEQDEAAQETDEGAEAAGEEQGESEVAGEGEAEGGQAAGAAVVVQLDDGFLLAGIAGEAAPRVVTPVGRHDGLAGLLAQAYQELGVEPGAQPLLVAELPGGAPAEREELARVALEQLQVGGYLPYSAGVLALFAAGRTRGLAIVSTPSGSRCIPVYEGVALTHAITGVDVSEGEVLDFLAKILGERGVSLSGDGDARAILEAVGYVAEDFDAEQVKAAQSAELERSVTLGDGSAVTVGAERFRATEALFKPELIGLEQVGLHKAAYEAVMKVDVGLRPDLLTNVVVAGRIAAYPGLAVRLRRELTALVPPSMTVAIAQVNDARELVWLGGGMVAQSLAGKDAFITKAELEASGPAILDRKAG